MRVLFVFEGGQETVVPAQYNHIIEACIYSSVSKELARFLHTDGFVYGRRSFKLFTFSRLFGNYRRTGKSLVFTGSISLLVSSPISRFVEELTNGIIKSGGLQLGERKLTISKVYFPKRPELGTKVLARTLSPITAYSTLQAADGSKKTYYYSPYEREFSSLISENARKKAFLVFRKRLRGGLQITPVSMKESFVIYKGTVVRGWSGRFMLRGPKRLIEVTYDAGLGSKNSEGFGMYEVEGAPGGAEKQ